MAWKAKHVGVGLAAAVALLAIPAAYLAGGDGGGAGRVVVVNGAQRTLGYAGFGEYPYQGRWGTNAERTGVLWGDPQYTDGAPYEVANGAIDDPAVAEDVESFDYTARVDTPHEGDQFFTTIRVADVDGDPVEDAAVILTAGTVAPEVPTTYVIHWGVTDGDGELELGFATRPSFDILVVKDGYELTASETWNDAASMRPAREDPEIVLQPYEG